MAQKITFTFPASTIPILTGRILKFYTDSVNTENIRANFTPTLVNGTDPYTFNISEYPTSLSNTEVIKGASVNNFANNFKLYLDAQLPLLGFYFETSIADNVVELIWGNNAEVNTFELRYLNDEDSHDSTWLTFTQEVYTIPAPIEAITLPEQIVLSRSPYHFKVSPSVTYDEITAEVFIYRGHKVDDRPATSNYQLSKSVVQVGQPTISFDVHRLVNDFVKNKYTTIGISGAFTSSLLDSVWVYIDSKVRLAGVEQYQVNQTLLAIDGFGYHTELSNPLISNKILSSITNHIVYNSALYPLYFITEGLISITADATDIPLSFNQDYSNQKIGYINASGYSSITFEYDTDIVHTFTNKTECKYPLINCIFKNKFGVWQTIPFNRLSKKSQDFTNESYNGLISTYGSYSLNQHEKQTFNVNGKEKVTVNTDFISEEYNALFTELMLSEFIYLEENGQVLPVNLLKNSFEKKTKLINKLIQYSMDFEYSFNILNDVL